MQFPALDDPKNKSAKNGATYPHSDSPKNVALIKSPDTVPTALPLGAVAMIVLKLEWLLIMPTNITAAQIKIPEVVAPTITSTTKQIPIMICATAELNPLKHLIQRNTAADAATFTTCVTVFTVPTRTEDPI